jgi:PAS domain S-box-containing protein
LIRNSFPTPIPQLCYNQATKPMATANSKRPPEPLHQISTGEEQYIKLLDLSPMPIAIHDKGILVYANDEALRLIGAKDRSEVLGMNITQIVHPDFHEVIFKRVQEIYKGNREHTELIEEKLIRLDGEIIDAEIVSQLITYKGKPCIQVIVRDITERKRAETALRQSEERFRTLIEQSADAIQLVDGQGKMFYSSDSVERVVGYTPAELLKKNVEEFIHPEDFPYFSERFVWLVQNPGKQINIEYRVKHKNGSWVWLEATGVNHLNNPSINALVANFRNITDRKGAFEELAKIKSELEDRVEQRTEELIKANKELQRSNKELEDFAYVASHDLREPLRKITSFSNLLEVRHKKELSESAQMYVESMKKASTRMNTLINDLLTYSRVATKAQPFKEVNLNKVIEEAIEDVQIRIEQSKAKVTVERLGTIEADALQLRLLFQNILSNALKYKQENIIPRISIKAKQKDNTITLFIKDNGIGFDEKYLDRIFTIFQRLHGKGIYDGTGIGLAICKKIIERHNGTITAKSVEGKGTTFIVTLPLKQRVITKKS